MATIQQLAAIPYLDARNLGGRTITSLCFYDAGAWRMWLEAEGAGLVEVQAWPAESTYFGNEPAHGDDLCLHFLNFMAQRACFPEVMRAVKGIHDDFFNLSASIGKIEHLHQTRATVGAGAHRMVIAEVEYLFLICRSIFDLLQEIACKLWETVRLDDLTVIKKPLKTSFNDMARYRGQPVTREVTMQRFGLPAPWADFYVGWQDFFGQLRMFRDNVVHNGSRVQSVFVDDTGFQIANALRPFAAMNVWRADERGVNDLVPLMPALGVVVYQTLAACDHFSRVVGSSIAFPPPVAPGMHLFMRGYFNESFSRILRDAGERMPRVLAATEVD